MSGNEVQPKASHPIRLAFRMVVGAFAGLGAGVLTHAVGDGGVWFRTAPFVYAIAGAALGLCVEIFTRSDEPTKRELLLTAVILGLVAISWALIR
jgi:hypothetical protein